MEVIMGTEVWIQSVSGGFYLNELRAWKYSEARYTGDLKSPSYLSILIKGGEGLIEWKFYDVEADSLIQTIKEFKNIC